MKWQTLVLINALLLAVGGRADTRTHEPDLVDIPLSKAFVPVGFDDNDRVQVVVKGAFPSTCYKVGPYEITRDAATRTLSIRQKAYRYRGVCLQLPVSFTQVVDAGLLGEGQYLIKDTVSAASLGSLSVGRSSNPGPDDHLYAPVSDAYVDTDVDNAHRLVLRGTFPSRCLKIKEVRVSYYSDVLVVQPIAEMTRPESGDCDQGELRFSHRVSLSGSPTGAHLLHVRSLNGQAINKVIQPDLRGLDSESDIAL